MGDWFIEFGVWGLAVVSFLESSFFPIPPDLILIPLALAHTEWALLYGMVTTVASVAGALLGYWIGRRVGRPVLVRFFGAKRIEIVERYFAKRGGAAVAIAAFTPIPYKLFTIMAGVCRISKRELVFWSFIGRGGRFMMEVGFIIVLGPIAIPILKDYFGWITFGVVAIVAIFYFIFRYIKKQRITL
ncbi:MAG: VTT domain-containing protein [Bacilli bacterium]